jgi:hypothetical protein
MKITKKNASKRGKKLYTNMYSIPYVALSIPPENTPRNQPIAREALYRAIFFGSFCTISTYNVNKIVKDDAKNPNINNKMLIIIRSFVINSRNKVPIIPIVPINTKRNRF